MFSLYLSFFFLLLLLLSNKIENETGECLGLSRIPEHAWETERKRLSLLLLLTRGAMQIKRKILVRIYRIYQERFFLGFETKPVESCSVYESRAFHG